MQKIQMRQKPFYRPGQGQGQGQGHMFGGMREPVRIATGRFLVSNHNINGRSVKMLHLQANFKRNPNMYSYEISGSNGFKMDGTNHINNTENNPMIILTFNCHAGETYFCKIIAYYSKIVGRQMPQPQQSQQMDYETEEFRLFYKVNDDFDEEIDVVGQVKDDDDAETELEEVSDREGEQDEEVDDTDIANIRQYMFSNSVQGNGLDIKESDDETLDISKI